MQIIRSLHNLNLNRSYMIIFVLYRRLFLPHFTSIKTAEKLPKFGNKYSMRLFKIKIKYNNESSMKQLSLKH